MTPTGTGRRWAVVVPVKRLDRAKTRLAVPSAQRRDLALAFAVDVMAAAAACPGVRLVVVVTDDSLARDRLSGMSHVRVVPDAPDAGLNAALAYAATQATRLGPGGLGVAAVSSDLPALRPDELYRALAEVPEGGRALVADAAGVGTTLLAAAAGQPLLPQFGARSRARHVRSGARDIALPGIPGLRRDVDTEVDLWDAVRLGVGAATAAVLEHVPAHPQH